MRPDPTPPDASLFPIAPTYTADLDAKALDEIVKLIDRTDLLSLASKDRFFATDSNGPLTHALALVGIRAAVRSTGRTV